MKKLQASLPAFQARVLSDESDRGSKRPIGQERQLRVVKSHFGSPSDGSIVDICSPEVPGQFSLSIMMGDIFEKGCLYM
jgi:hypothetical protein